MADKEYTRLTWSHARSLFSVAVTSRSSLWLGKNHVLSIDTNGYTENYKRFYFRDIQAIVIRKTENWKFIALALGAVTFFLGLVAALVSEPGVRYVFGGLGGLFGIGLIAGLAQGPSSTCHLSTAVQTEQLPSLNRLRRARRVLGQLQPLIAQAQGQLASEAAPPKIDAEPQPTAPTDAIPNSTTTQ